MSALTIEWTWMPVLIALPVIFRVLCGWRNGVGSAVMILMLTVLYQFIEPPSGWASDAALVASVPVASLIWDPVREGRWPRHVGSLAVVGALSIVALHVV